MYQFANKWNLDEANRIERNKTDEVEQVLWEMFKKNCKRLVPEIYKTSSPEEWTEFCRCRSNNIAANFEDEPSS